MSDWFANSIDAFANDLDKFSNGGGPGFQTMDITAAVKQYIVDLATVSGGRVYHDVAKQDAGSPYVVLAWDFGGSEETIGLSSGIARATVQIFVYDSQPSNAFDNAERIRLGEPEIGNEKPFYRFRGDLKGARVLDVTSSDGYERGSVPPTKGAPAGLWWVSRDYSLTYRETIEQ